jgi:hypothetical protein
MPDHNLEAVLEELRAKATERTKATYLRHAVAEPVLGVLHGDLEKLRKRLRVNHSLAQALWATDLYEARYLATLIADVRQTSEAELTAWGDSAQDGASAGALAAFAARTPYRQRLIEAWVDSPRTTLQSAGWSLLGGTLLQDPDFPEDQARAWVARVERDIHGASNWLRRTMMYTLIGLGAHREALRTEAEAAIRRIGPVAFDPGRTACEFPDPLPYLARMWARKAAKKN